MLGDNQKQDIVCLLNEFRDCFTLNLKELGCTKLTAINIQEIAGSKPVYFRPYKTNSCERNIIKK